MENKITLIIILILVKYIFKVLQLVKFFTYKSFSLRFFPCFSLFHKLHQFNLKFNFEKTQTYIFKFRPLQHLLSVYVVE